MRERTTSLFAELSDNEEPMKKFEYKFVPFPNRIFSTQEEKLKTSESQWNKLGNEGWEFCKEGNGCIIFKRELDAEADKD